MNKERYNQIIDEVYEGYLNYPLATIHDHHTNILYQNRNKGWCMLNGRSIASPHPTRHLTREEFINKCKTDSEFSEKWGLKIEERELSLDERADLSREKRRTYANWPYWSLEEMEYHLTDVWNIPTKLITLEYKQEKIYIYE